MKQLHIRFGTSSASDTKDSDHGEPLGPLAGEDPALEVDDPLHFHQPLQSTQQILLATGDNNQLIGILEEDSEDFDDEDEDEDDDDDLDGGQKGDYFQAEDTDMFNEEDEGKRGDLGALDEVLEEDLLSDDGMGNAGDSGGEEFDRDQNTQSDDGGTAPAKPEKKKKKKKPKQQDASAGPNTENTSPTKAGKKDLKEKKKSAQLTAQPQGNQMMSPQIKITIQSKTGKVGKEQSAASPQVIL
jgi:hypothetical protein